MLSKYSTMDPNLLRQIEYFLDPADQSATLDSQQQGLFDSPAGEDPSMQNFWDSAGVDSALGSASSAPTNLSFESLGQASPHPDKEPLEFPNSQQDFAQVSRAILAPRPPKAKAGHERKRTKLSTESTPFDNVDYWIQFDNEEATASEESRCELSHQKAREPQPQPSRETQPQKEHQQQRPPHSQTSSSPGSASRDGGSRRFRAQELSSSDVAGASSSRPLHRSFRPEDLLEDEALDYALSEEGDLTAESFGSINLADQMSGIDFMPPTEVPPREGLYSTPLSWEKPQPGLRPESLMSMQSLQQLNEEEQRRLIAIAMNIGPIHGGLGINPFGQSSGSRGYVPGGGLHANLDSVANLAALGNFSGGLGDFTGFGAFGGLVNPGMDQTTDAAPMLKPDSPAVATPSKKPALSRTNTAKSMGKGRAKDKEKRKDGEEDEDDDDDNDGKESKGKNKSGDRTAHNDIERKYRTNLKDRIAELRDAVPALRTIQEGKVDEGDDNTPGKGPKVSKGTVLTKATEYISQLEKQNQTILAKHQQLSRRLAAFEQLLSQAARPAFQMPSYSRTLFDPRAFC